LRGIGAIIGHERADENRRHGPPIIKDLGQFATTQGKKACVVMTRLVTSARLTGFVAPAAASVAQDQGLGGHEKLKSPYRAALLGLGLTCAALCVVGCHVDGSVLDPDSPPVGDPAPGDMTGVPGAPPASTPGMPIDPTKAAAPPSTMAVPVCSTEELPGPRRLRLLTRAEYANSVVDLLGVPLPEVDNLPVETVIDGFDNNAAAAAVTSRHIDEYLATAERLAKLAVMQNRWRLATCPAGNGCDRMFITAFGRKAFRRPLLPAEIDRYAKLFDPAVTGGVFEKGMELTLRTMLSSPNFIYRSEMGEKAADGTYKLTPYEVATALSYLFWRTTPDDQLLDAAKAGTLDQPAGFEQQVKRLIADPRSRPAIASFFRQWLGTDGLLFTNKDSAIFPGFTDAIRKALVEEQDTFVNYVVFEGSGKLPELFTAPYVFANQGLAQFYGLPAGAGATMTKVAMPVTGATRGGLLTLGAVVGMHAHSNESSPVRRGLFVRARLLCQTLPLPPADVDTTPPGLDPTLTTRARFQRHSSDPKCQGCHKLIDPVGFGFERYDGVGAYRAQEAGADIDASGKLIGLEDLGDASELPFSGPLELGKILSTSPNAQACVARQLYRFARGGENGGKDACAISKLQGAFRESGFDLQRLLLEVVRGKSFLTRGE
jgi:hypothetical protein